MTTRRWTDKEKALQYAAGYGEECDVMESEDGRYWVVIHPYGTTLWREHGYKVVAMYRLTVTILKERPEGAMQFQYDQQPQRLYEHREGLND